MLVGFLRTAPTLRTQAGVGGRTPQNRHNRERQSALINTPAEAGRLRQSNDLYQNRRIYRIRMPKGNAAKAAPSLLSHRASLAHFC